MKNLSRFALLSAVLVVVGVGLATAWDGGVNSRQGSLVEYGTLNVEPELELVVGVGPHADAFADVWPNPAQVDQEVFLNGTGSSGYPEPITYLWKQVFTGAPSVNIVNPNGAVASFTPAFGGTYKFKLTVTNQDGTESDFDEVEVVVEGPAKKSSDSGCSLGVADSSFAGIASWSLPYLMLTGLWAISLIRRKRLSSNS
jgi:K319L-like, PKD domain